MAMSRFALARKTLAFPALFSPRVQPQRHRSGKANQGQLIELDLDASASPSSSSDGEAIEVISGGVRKLEEVIQSIIARRTAPDWLPFLPGYSYWVPPTNPKAHPGKLIEVIGKVSAAPPSRQPPLTPDENLSLSSCGGWPSSSFFIEGTAPSHPVPMELEVEVKIFHDPADESNNEDEEG